MLSLIAITAHVIQSQTHTVTHNTSEHHPHCSGKPTNIIQQHSETQTLVSEFIQVHSKLCFLQSLLTLLAFHGRYIYGFVQPCSCSWKGGMEDLRLSRHRGVCVSVVLKEGKKWRVLFPFPFALPGTDFLSGCRCSLGEWRNVARRGC